MEDSAWDWDRALMRSTASRDARPHFAKYEITSTGHPILP